MADISKYLEDILSAIYGEEVRHSIHDAIDAINKEVYTGVEDAKAEVAKAAAEAAKAAASATSAQSSADSAAQSVVAAATEADNAAGSATSAASSASEAASSATLSRSWATGDTASRPGEENNNSKFYAEQAQRALSSISGSLVAMGTIPFEELPPSPLQSGVMYNISNEFTTDSRFNEGAGHKYGAGTNVYWTAESKWDCLAAPGGTGDDAYSPTNKPEVGGRNLLLNSGVPVTNSNHLIQAYTISDKTLKDGEKVIVTLKGTLGSGRIQFDIYNTDDRYLFFLSDKGNGYYQAVGSWKHSETGNHTLLVYTGSVDVTTESTIEWIKLERGEIATDWSPAPEDLEAKIDNLQIGGRNLLLGTKDFSGNWENKWAAAIESEKYMGLTVASRDVAWNNIHQEVTVPAGTYTISAYVRTDEGVEDAGFAIGFGGDNKYIIATPQWTRYSTTAQREAGTYNAIVNPAKNKKIYFCGLKLERGNKSTDWSPAPEDLETTAENFEGVLPVEKGGMGNNLGKLTLDIRHGDSVSWNKIPNSRDLHFGHYDNPCVTNYFFDTTEKSAGADVWCNNLHANNLPTIATSTTAGLVKPGEGLQISDDGTLSVVDSGGGSGSTRYGTFMLTGIYGQGTQKDLLNVSYSKISGENPNDFFESPLVNAGNIWKTITDEGQITFFSDNVHACSATGPYIHQTIFEFECKNSHVGTLPIIDDFNGSISLTAITNDVGKYDDFNKLSEGLKEQLKNHSSSFYTVPASGVMNVTFKNIT